MDSQPDPLSQFSGIAFPTWPDPEAAPVALEAIQPETGLEILLDRLGTMAPEQQSEYIGYFAARMTRQDSAVLDRLHALLLERIDAFEIRGIKSRNASETTYSLYLDLLQALNLVRDRALLAVGANRAGLKADPHG